MSQLFISTLVGASLCATGLQASIRLPFIKLLRLWGRRSILFYFGKTIYGRMHSNGKNIDHYILVNRGYVSVFHQIDKPNYADFYLILFAMFGLTAIVAGGQLLISVPLGMLLSILMIFDLRWFWLPDRITLPLSAIGLLLAWGDAQLSQSILGLLGAATVFMLVRISYRAARSIEGLGLGDVKLAAAIGAWLGLTNFFLAIVLASALGIVITLAKSYASGRAAKGNERLPFGVHLSASFWIVWCLASSSNYPFLLGLLPVNADF